MCSNSQKKMKVLVTKKLPFKTGKRWAKVEFNHHDTVWIPSFEDLHRIIQAICYCEDEKYPYGKGRLMVAEFLKDAVQESNFEVLAQKYLINRENCND